MKAQAYIEIDHKSMKDEEFKEFLSMMNKYFINYKEIGVVNGREYDSVILRDTGLLHDKTDEEGNTTYGILTILNNRNIIINGAWDVNGVPLGMTKVVENNGTEEEPDIKIKYIGEPLYPFDLALHIKHTPDIIYYDEEGDVISRTPAMQFKPLHKFSGWGEIIEY